MSRKDYREAARKMSDLLAWCEDNYVSAPGPRDAAEWGAYASGVAAATREFADLFAADNGSFDRQRFYAAAGLNENGRLPSDWGSDDRRQ